MVSLSQIQEVPSGSMILVVGLPGSGKSTFCQQVVLNGIVSGRSIIFVTTERNPSDIFDMLRDKGMGELQPGALNFVDAFGETVGLSTLDRPDTIYANCEDLNSISMAISKLRQGLDKKDVLLAFDSLTSPYLFNKGEVFRFMRLCLLKFTAEGNSVLALVDESCGKQEDMVAIKSVPNGIINMEIENGSRILNIIKHPKLAPAQVKMPKRSREAKGKELFGMGIQKHMTQMNYMRREGTPMRAESGDIINLFWRNLASWSGMLWDPKRFPKMAYEFDKEAEARGAERLISRLPWSKKTTLKMFMPKSFSKVKDMKKFSSAFLNMGTNMGIGLVEYMDKSSKKDEHMFRMYESSSCWSFENVGARLAFHDCGEWAGFLNGIEKIDRDWNVVETKCIGTGSPYCEIVAKPTEMVELREFLENIDTTSVERIHDCLMGQLTEFVIHNKPLAERPRLKGTVSFHEMHHVTSLPASISPRYRMALRMGGAKAGKEVGEHLMEAGLDESKVIERVLDLMEHCKVGKVTVGDTIRIKENCEIFGLLADEPSCYFTTGFLNGLFSIVKNQRVKEINCIATGHPYCEWEIA